METIEQKYEPFNYSTTRCYVFVLRIDAGGYYKIEHKVPSYVQNLKGIFVTTNGKLGKLITSGVISLNFNGQAMKCFQMPVSKTSKIEDCSLPVPVNEILKLNSFIQGYYYAFPGNNEFSYELSIYLHYEP